MISPDLHTVITPLQLDVLFTNPLLFIAAWLLLGWLLLQPTRGQPANTTEVVDPHQHPEDDGLNTLQLAILGVSLYILIRYWRNR